MFVLVTVHKAAGFVDVVAMGNTRQKANGHERRVKQTHQLGKELKITWFRGELEQYNGNYKSCGVPLVITHLGQTSALYLHDYYNTAT